MSDVQSASYSFAGRTVLLAADDSPHSAGAAHVALDLAERLHASIHVLSVLDTRSVPIPPGIGGALQIAHEVVGSGVHAEQEQAVRDRLATTLGRNVDWPIRMSVGVPSNAIVREARRVDAAMIVMGLRPHGRADRVLNDETTLNVVRAAPCPVFGVVPGLQRLPSRVLAAVDFSSASLSAASVARALIPQEGSLTLAYVSLPAIYPADDGQTVIHSLGVQAGFQRASGELGGNGLSVGHVVLQPKPKQQVSELLLEHAEEISAEVIAAGSARLSRVQRWMLGSVTTDLLREGRISVLVVPPADTRQ
jgi:nucleotide-binding universal stress UspA family protein